MHTSATILGNLVRDPEKRFTTSGTAVCDMTVASNRRYKGHDGEQRDEATFVSVQCWGATANSCAEHLAKGSLVYVAGRLKMDQWEKDGKKQSKLYIVADVVQFLSRKEKTIDQAAPVAPSPLPQVKAEDKPDDLPF
jgi:single-strand DNA-binding protein